jgi:hypothetical protein
MNEFVNSKKRGVTLPPGCKDLIDLLRPAAEPAVERAQRRLAATRDETVTGVLSDLGKYVRMAFESRGVMFALVITPPDERLEVGVSRMEGEEPWVSVTFPDEPEEEKLVCAFFSRKGLKIPEGSGKSSSFSSNLPMKMNYSVSPLPRDAEHISELIADLLRQCARMENDAPLRFDIMEASEAA